MEVTLGVGAGSWEEAKWGRAVGARRAIWQVREGNTGEGGDGRGQKGKMAVARLRGSQEEGGGQMTGGSGARGGMAVSLGQGDGRGGRL